MILMENSFSDADYASWLQDRLKKECGIDSERREEGNTTWIVLSSGAKLLLHARTPDPKEIERMDIWFNLYHSLYEKLQEGDYYALVVALSDQPFYFLLPTSKVREIFSNAPFAASKRAWDFHVAKHNGSYFLTLTKGGGLPHTIEPNTCPQTNDIKDAVDVKNIDESAWIRDLIDAFMRLGGSGKYYHLDDIYSAFADIRNSRNDKLPEHYENIVRYYLQLNSRGSRRDLFQPKEIGSGHWMLKETQLNSDSSLPKEILSCLQTIRDDDEKIQKARNALELFLSRYPYHQQPDLIDSLQTDDVYKPGSETTFYYYWSKVAEPVGRTGAEATVWRITDENLKLFKDLLKEAVKQDKPLSKKIDEPWEKISGFGGEKSIPKKIIYLYNSDKALAVFNMQQMELFSTRLGKKYTEKARAKYGKDYDALSNGEKYELHTELLLEAKDEINSQFNKQWDNTTFWRFLYHCLLKSEPSSIVKDWTSLKSREIEEIVDYVLNGDGKRLEIERDVVRRIINHLIAGKNVILVGPPGTGKTDLASRLLKKLGSIIYGTEDFVTAVASYEWGRFEVIGGNSLKTDSSGNYVFHLGCVLTALNENKMLLIDEFNRADMNKAFGEMFRAVDHGRIELREDEVPPESLIANNEQHLSSNVIMIPNRFRMICTMNDYDKSILNELSYGLLRRFAFVEVNGPEDKESIKRIVKERVVADLQSLGVKDIETIFSKIENDLLDKFVSFILQIRDKRSLGTSTLIDVVRYIVAGATTRAENDYWKLLGEALVDYVLPQLDRLDSTTLIAVRDAADLFRSDKMPNGIEPFINRLNGMIKKIQAVGELFDR